MQLGYVPSFGVGSRPAEWISGEPPERLIDSLRALGDEPSEHHRIATYRCAGCGLLLDYAPEGPPAG